MKNELSTESHPHPLLLKSPRNCRRPLPLAPAPRSPRALFPTTGYPSQNSSAIKFSRGTCSRRRERGNSPLGFPLTGQSFRFLSSIFLHRSYHITSLANPPCFSFFVRSFARRISSCSPSRFLSPSLSLCLPSLSLLLSDFHP